MVRFACADETPGVDKVSAVPAHHLHKEPLFWVAALSGVKCFWKLCLLFLPCPFACTPNENYANADGSIALPGSGEGMVTVFSKCVISGAGVSDGGGGSLWKMQIPWVLLRTTELGSV